MSGALASLAIPGIGPVVALGVLGAALFGVGGAVVGGALDHSLREGLPRDELYVYAESLDAAREQWWIGLRDAEAEAYEGGGRRFAGDETRYRQGFEAALSADCRGRAYGDVIDELERRHADACRDEAFRRGYDRGQRWDAATRREPSDRAA